MKHKGKILAVVVAVLALGAVAASYFGSVATVATMHATTNGIHVTLGEHQASVVRKISPSNLVAVQNTVILPRTNLAGLFVQGATPGKLSLGTNTQFVTWSASDDGGMLLANTNQVTINSTNGNVGIGTNQPKALLHVRGSAIIEQSTSLINEWDHFLVVGGTEAGKQQFAMTLNSGAIGSTEVDTTHPGIVWLVTGASASAAPTISLGSSSCKMGAGREVDVEFVWRIEDLSDGTEKFGLLLGLHDATTSTLPTDSVHIYYNHATNSGNLVFVARAAGTETVSNTSTAVAADTWYTNRIVVNSTATLATLYHNGTSIATLASNIPDVDSAVERATALGAFQLIKMAGTTSRSLYVDFWRGTH